MRQTNHIKAPEAYKKEAGTALIFLAGSIEMGVAQNWQEKVALQLKDDPVTLLNPRREHWDSSWEQAITHPQFKEQVDWELAGLEAADFRLFHFEAATQSPITLLELGLMAHKGNNIVHCPTGFWRKGNVDVVCARYGIEQAESLQAAVNWLKEQL